MSEHISHGVTAATPADGDIAIRRPLRSRAWFDNPANPDMTALYLERYLNFGLSVVELQSNRPIIGIAQTGSDLAPCNRHHLILAERVRDGIRDAGGIPLEFPIHPIQETGKRPTAAIDRNLAYLSLVEVLHGYPIDGVVLTIGCDKTVPACLMAAATVNIPAIALSVGPMLNGWHKGERTGSGTIIWRALQMIVPDPVRSPLCQPFSMGPTDRAMAGMSTVAAAIRQAGTVLSQPMVRTTPSMG